MIKFKALSYFNNTIWMFFEHVLKMVVGILMAVIIARDLGPEKFGVLNYVLALVTIFIPICQLGMSTILVRELVNNPKKRKQIISTSFYLILVASSICFLILNSFFFLFDRDNKACSLILIYSTILFFKAFDVIEFNFQSQLKAKYSSIAKTLALLLSLCVKIFIVYKNLGLVFFIYAYTLDFVFLGLFLLCVHKLKESVNFLFGFDKELVYYLLKSSWPLILSSLSIILYMRLDQLMIEMLLDSKQLGLYSSAVRLYEGYLSVVFVITVSLLPAILKIKEASEQKFRHYMTLFFSVVFWANNILAILVMLFSFYIMHFLYGSEYTDASSVLGIVFWASGFASIGSVTARYFIVEKMEKKMILRTCVSLSVNLILNFLLIPIYGIEGSAMATVISIFIGNYVIDFFDKDLKVLLKLKNNGIFFRYNLKIK